MSMAGRTIFYRGNLKSCNYSCSYCPFSKRRASASQLDKDRKSFERFCDSIEDRAQAFSVGAVFVVPYGEASIHGWYWEGLGRLAALPGIERVGLQTNLSFSVEECLERFDLYGAAREGDMPGSLHRRREKLCIWATFHPEMTDADTFADKCRRLVESGVRLCAGAVGVPGNLPLLVRLREELPPDVYLWINKMDGLGRNYTEAEKKEFSALDPLFEMELNSPAAKAAMCADRCFVEADGRVRSCNIGRLKEANWYQSSREELFRPLCGKKRCSCYLAYGGRSDFEGKSFFGEYPAFRIPEKRRAVFLDLDGTLIPRGERGGLSDSVRRRLSALGKKCPVFLATSMPEEEVRKRLQDDLDLFRGAVFASGAHVRLYPGRDGEDFAEKGCREAVHPVNTDRLPELSEYARQVKARVRVCRKNRAACKITVLKRRHCHWNQQECGRITDLLAQSDCRIFVENHCLEVIGSGLDKGSGIRELCGWLGISPREVLAVGDDREDEAMAGVCGGYLRVSNLPNDSRKDSIAISAEIQYN